MKRDFFYEIVQALLTREPAAKVARVNAIYDTWYQHPKHCTAHQRQSVSQPGRPDKPELVQPKQLAKRKLSNPEGVASMVHAIAHIEFNAINLALDAIHRFSGLPDAFYDDWLQVAFEEAKHFTLLNQFLNENGYAYGDFSAHNGLWELAEATASDVLERMAVVPRVMEARGLDVTPGIRAKFVAIGCQQMVDILDIIFQEEIGHVQIGNRWFHTICEQRGLDSMDVFRQLAQKYLTSNQLKLPFHEQARLKAGFSENELTLLRSLAQA